MKNKDEIVLGFCIISVLFGMIFTIIRGEPVYYLLINFGFFLSFCGVILIIMLPFIQEEKGGEKWYSE